ncbi:uncharacterized protein At4g22758-like [Lycium barbarum]|uniref:uncharacterized protein At4g22758-like n=1 Tax=Lycium barbarum TaxID=112863 RepID=UPI00293EDDA9|nr:uncharacterized protein At4g22758-like [Lycium barbarum]
MLLYKAKKNQSGKGKRLLISITVLGSAGPIRFVVNEEQLVGDVIHTALKSYAREGRLPLLGSDFTNFVLYCPTATTQALSPWETIGSLGVRNFVLFKKASQAVDDGKQSAMVRKGAGSWKAWFNKSVARKIAPH